MQSNMAHLASTQRDYITGLLSWSWPELAIWNWLGLVQEMRGSWLEAIMADICVYALKLAVSRVVCSHVLVGSMVMVSSSGQQDSNPGGEKKQRA